MSTFRQRVAALLGIPESRLELPIKPLAASEELEATVPSQPITTTRNRSRRSTHMTDIDTRETALTLALDSGASHALVTNGGDLDNALLAGVFELAERLRMYLEGGSSDEVADDPEETTQAPISPRQQLLSLAEGKRAQYGTPATEALLLAIDQQMRANTSLEIAEEYLTDGGLDSTIGRGNARDFAAAISELPR